MKRPRTRALLPQSVARLLGLAALAAVGALEWQRLVAGLSSGRALLWVAVAVAARSASCSPSACREGWLRAAALLGVAFLALLAGYWLSGAGLDLLKPRHWDELLSGLGGGLQALGTVRLPYVSADPWPRIVLELLGAELLILAGLLTFWPRAPTAPEPRVPLTPPDRGYPFVALAVLLVVIASPVVSLGGTRSLRARAHARRADRLLPVARAAAAQARARRRRRCSRSRSRARCRSRRVADRGEPWFDYRSFAESLGPDDPVRFSWDAELRADHRGRATATR